MARNIITRIRNIGSRRTSSTTASSVFTVPTFDGEQFWFNRFMSKNLMTWGPFLRRSQNGKPNLKIEFTNVIGPRLYSHRNLGEGKRDFVEDMSSEMSFDMENPKSLKNIFNGVDNKELFVRFLNEGDKDPGRFSFAGCVSLIDNGITFERLLGKEFDNDINRVTIQELSKTLDEGKLSRTNEARWALLSSNEPRLTPSEAIRFLQMERLINDPELINNLMTQRQVMAAGGIFNPANPPEPVMYTNFNVPLYDMGATYPTRSIIPSYSYGRDINSFSHMTQIEDFDNFLKTLQESTGTKVVFDDTMPPDSVVVETSYLRSKGRQVADYVSRALGGEGYAVVPSATIHISANNTEAERTYLATKNLCKVAISRFLDEVEELVQKGAPNLPSSAAFAADRSRLEDIASCIIASQVVKMGNLSDDDQRVLSGIYKLEACQVLGQVQDKNNTWMMPLVASFTGMSLPKFAKDFNINLREYAVNNDLEPTDDLNSFVKILYAPKIVDPSLGVLSREKAALAINPDMFYRRIHRDTIDTRLGGAVTSHDESDARDLPPVPDPIPPAPAPEPDPAPDPIPDPTPDPEPAPDIPKEPVIKKKGKFKPGWVVSDTGMTFSIAQYSKDIARLASEVLPKELPVFTPGDELMNNDSSDKVATAIRNANTHSDVIVGEDSIETAEFVDEIRKRATKSISRILTSEYNRAVRASGKALSSSRVSKKRVEETGLKQDIASNVTKQFEKGLSGETDAAFADYREAEATRRSELNPRYILQLCASANVCVTAEELTDDVMEFYKQNAELLNGASAGTVYQVYMKTLGKGNVHTAIRNTVVKPLLNEVYDQVLLTGDTDTDASTASSTAGTGPRPV